MLNAPFFSIIIPTYNRAKLLNVTLDKVFNQSFKDFEVVVINDGSTDNTEQILKKYRDERLQYFTTPNQERAAARNFGVQHSCGKYITFLDSDDEFFTDHLEKAQDFIEMHYPPIFFQQYLIKTGNTYKKPYTPKQSINKELIKVGNFMSCMGVFLERKIANQFPFIVDRRLSGSEDYELWLRIAASHEIKYNDSITSALVNHEERSVVNVIKEDLIVRKLLMIEYLMKDAKAAKHYEKVLVHLKANAYSYISLHLSLDKKQKLAALRYLGLTLATEFNYILRRRTWSTIRNLIL